MLGPITPPLLIPEGVSIPQAGGVNTRVKE